VPHADALHQAVEARIACERCVSRIAVEKTKVWLPLPVGCLQPLESSLVIAEGV
jgi:hypothetical protein